MFFSGVVSLRRLRAIFALELTELRLCFYTKNERRNFHSACEAARLYYLSNMPMVIAMRVFLVVIGIVPALLGSILSARSDEIPSLDVKQLCRGIASQATDPLAGGEPTVTFDRCMNGEQADREALKKVWSTFPVDDKKHCTAETQMGGESSYTELITCLEMALAVRSERTNSQNDATTVAPHHLSLSKGRAHVRSSAKRVRSRYRRLCPPRRAYLK
jgi:hypothetical protein